MKQRLIFCLSLFYLGFRKSKKRGGSPVQDEVASKKHAK